MTHEHTSFPIPNFPFFGEPSSAGNPKPLGCELWGQCMSLFPQLVPLITRNYLKQGFMEKTGPKVYTLYRSLGGFPTPCSSGRALRQNLGGEKMGHQREKTEREGEEANVCEFLGSRTKSRLVSWHVTQHCCRYFPLPSGLLSLHQHAICFFPLNSVRRYSWESIAERDSLGISSCLFQNRDCSSELGAGARAAKTYLYTHAWVPKWAHPSPAHSQPLLCSALLHLPQPPRGCSFPLLYAGRGAQLLLRLP